MQAKVTIRDIARHVGKSITTVSRALADYDDVSSETKELVRKAAVELGYTPNSFAQRLRKQRTDTIGIILPTFGPRFSDPFFSEFIAGIGNQAAESGYDLLVSTRSPGEEEMLAYEKNIQSRRVDGFIIVRTRCKDARIEYLLSQKKPFVAFGRSEIADDFDYVDEDSLLGMIMLTDHLIELGHRRIAFIAAPQDLMFASYRLQGYKQALQREGIDLDGEMIAYGDLSQRSGYREAQKLLAMDPIPSAIIASNDLMAIGAMSAAQDASLTVGLDISIAGFDDIPLAEHIHPSLTTVHQPIYKIGKQVCEMLVDKIEGRNTETQHYLLQPTLVIRHSTAPVSSQRR